MDDRTKDIARQRLVAQGFELLQQRRTGQSNAHGSETAERSASFDDLTADEVRLLSSEDIAMLARIRRSLVRLASGMYGACAACGDPIGMERLLAAPAVDSCFACVRKACRFQAHASAPARGARGSSGRRHPVYLVSGTAAKVC
jgi:RNA polymerase-binding transcription factor DksA